MDHHSQEQRQASEPGQELAHSDQAIDKAIYTAITELIQLAQSATTPRQLAKSAVTWLVRTLLVDYCEVLQLADDEGSLLPCALSHPDALEPGRRLSIEPKSQAAYTLHNTAPVVVADFRSEARFTAPLLPYHHNVISSISVAIQRQRDRAFGILNVASTRQRVFTQSEVDFVRTVATLIGMIAAQWDAEQTVELQSGLLDVIEEAVIAIDLEGRIISWNQAAAALYGLPAREALGRDMLNVIPLYEDKGAAREWLARVRRGQRWSAEYQVPRRGGSAHLLQVHWFPLRNALGMPLGAVSIHCDVSKQRWAEQARRQAEEGLDPEVAERTQELLRANRRLQQEIARRDRLALELSEVRRLLHQSQEAERLRLARELHDGPLQDLTALGLELSLLAATVSEE
ncbi:MAG TPA: PAS domain S-box protein, partial [Caldilineaceae bacterium]|nr:PAS domain S-box protein [Caldilineaceae bacterium]